MTKAKTFFLETRPQFLILTPAAFSVGIAAAVYAGYSINWFHLVLAFIGSLCAHITVNVINDYYDFVRGTDMLVNRTPFSGGSGLLPSGEIKAKEALALGVGSLAIGLAIGAFFIFKYPFLIYIVLSAAFLSYFYTPILTRVYITELFPGLGFGPLLIVGTYITQLPVGTEITLSSLLLPFMASLPVAFLVTNLLWVNEIPDYDADRQTGRKHGVILVGKKNASLVYVLFLVCTYVSLIIGVAWDGVPIYALLGLLTVPVAMKASQGVIHNYDRTDMLVPSLGQNVLVVIATPVLMTIGFFIGSALR